MLKKEKPDIIVIAGDVLHTHERLHTIVLNKAYELIENMRNISKTFVLVGNHDLINNQQILTNNHWMNGMKGWDNTVIVDTVITECLNDEKFVFVPFVPPGKFIYALDTIGDEWKDCTCIFAHQEFSGCKMGAIISIEGDKWPLEYPKVISGHIHSHQNPQYNIYYPGSAMQIAFGESEKNIIPLLTFDNDDGNYDCEEIDLGLPRKKIVYMDVDDIEDYQVPESEDSIKVTLSGNYEQFKALKKTEKYKKLMNDGVKVVFKPKKIDMKNEKIEVDEYKNGDETDFNNILETIVTKKKDPYLLQVFELIINNKEIDVDDIIFMN